SGERGHSRHRRRIACLATGDGLARRTPRPDACGASPSLAVPRSRCAGSRARARAAGDDAGRDGEERSARGDCRARRVDRRVAVGGARVRAACHRRERRPLERPVGRGRGGDRRRRSGRPRSRCPAPAAGGPPLNTLALVAALLVGADPLSVVDPAFILTFGATLAIIVVVPVVTSGIPAGTAAQNAKNAKNAKKNLAGIRRSLIAMFAASVAAEAMLFPVGALVFSRVTFAGLALNFLAIPMMAVAQIAGMAVVPIALVSHTAAAATGWIAHIDADGLVRSADLVRLAPAVAFR